MIKLIHPKTGTVREVPKQNQNKLRILKRGGFIPFEDYRPKKKPEVVPDPSLAEVVEGEKADPLEAFGVPAPEVAIHVSPAARKLAEEKGVDLSSLEGSGKDGGVVLRDVQKFLKAEKPEPVVRDATEEEEAAEAELSKEVDPPAEDEVEDSDVVTDVELGDSPTANTEEEESE